MTQALRSGDGCVLVTGDSRMAAGFDRTAFVGEAALRGKDVCVADLAIGATGLSAQVPAVRTYLQEGARPRVIVLGIVPESIVQTEPEDPDAWVGNNLAVLRFSRLSDERIHFGQMSWLSPRRIDGSLRFVLKRANGMGLYVSLVWEKIDQARKRLVGQVGGGQHNDFGLLSDMQVLENSFIKNGQKAIELGAHGRALLSPWFAELEELAKAHGVEIWIVQLPMPKEYQLRISDSADGKMLTERIRHDFLSSGGRWFDVSHEDWLQDALFSDGIHLGPHGAARLSKAMADAFFTRLP